MSAYPYQPGAPAGTLDPTMVTTALELPGYRIVRNIGVVRGIVVRSRNLFATLGAGLQTILGGNITLYSQLCEKTRQDAFVMMMDHAAPARRKRRHRRPLRRQRTHAGRHRSPRLRQPSMSKSFESRSADPVILMREKIARIILTVILAGGSLLSFERL